MKRLSALLFFWGIFCFISQNVYAEWNNVDKKFSASFEAGSTAQGSPSFRLVGAYWFPKALKLSNGLDASLRIELDMGLLDTTDTAFDIGFQPVIRIEYKGCKFKPYFDFGGGIHFLSRANIDERKLGGGHQFSLLAGTGILLGNNIGFGYRYFHISNANIHSHNHGRDEHIGVITIYF